MPQIKKIVMLMLENRSLDNLLGWLYHNEALQPDRVFPEGSSLRFDGISPSDVNYIDTERYAPSHGTQERTQPMRQPRYNPDELWKPVGNQMYWNAYGKDSVPRWSAATPPMTGFARDYSRWYDTPDEVMGAYSEAQLPVLYGLARSFAISDRWFSSVPTETNPNRAFSVCGSSAGAVDNKDISVYDLPTIFNALTQADPKRSWGIYYQYNGMFDMDPTRKGRCYTEDIFPYIRRAVVAGEGIVHRYDTFLQTLSTPDLPDFSYIEPFWGGGYGLPDDDFIGLQGNDYHSPAWVGPAEYDLNELYNALRTSRYWDDMLFIISFDEHGGTYDHVPPPVTVKPDSIPSKQKFEFNRMGVRVPTILVSPYVQPGTVFRAPTGSKFDFDHTSLIATILKWAGLHPKNANMGLRVASAPTFDLVLSDTRSGQRPPTFKVPAEYSKQGGKKGPHNIPFDIGKMPFRTFQNALDLSTSVEDFLDRLRREVLAADMST